MGTKSSNKTIRVIEKEIESLKRQLRELKTIDLYDRYEENPETD